MQHFNQLHEQQKVSKSLTSVSTSVYSKQNHINQKQKKKAFPIHGNALLTLREKVWIMNR